MQLTLSPPEAGHNSLSSNRYVPILPKIPSVSSSTLQVYIIPAESSLFVSGFDAHEIVGRPPTLLRGLLYVRVLKLQRIKSISLTFRGVIRTEWPEGLPPKRTAYAESNDEISHTWPFYQVSNLYTAHNGADSFVDFASGHDTNLHHTVDDLSHLCLGDSRIRSISLISSDRLRSTHSSFFRSSKSPDLRSRQLSPQESGSYFLSRALSPGQFMRRSNSQETHFSDISSITSSTDIELQKAGYFAPGDYIYNFEHPVQSSIHESCHFTFGQVSYYLEASIVRYGKFKSNLVARMPIDIVRIPSENSMEENEPIIVMRDWEDQMRYEIIIGSKSVVLDSYLPIAVRFIPLQGKIQLHRIRIYISENMEYYNLTRKVHRMEPAKKYLLLEHKACNGGSLLSNDDSGNDDELFPRELEFQVYIPKTLNKAYSQILHPDTSFQFMQAHHWIKIGFRISKFDPENPKKRKHYEISIDSPIRILSPMASHDNTLLPVYNEAAESILQRDSCSPLPILNGISPDLRLSDSAAVLNQMFSANLKNSASLDEMIDSTEQPLNLAVASITNGTTEEKFHHLNFATESVATRDLNMHLESNVYKPAMLAMSGGHSTQAQPHPQNFSSPIIAPLSRPIHLLLRPSTNPPPFDANADPGLMMEIAPPPSYEPQQSVNNPIEPQVAIGIENFQATAVDSQISPDISRSQEYKALGLSQTISSLVDSLVSGDFVSAQVHSNTIVSPVSVDVYKPQPSANLDEHGSQQSVLKEDSKISQHGMSATPHDEMVSSINASDKTVQTMESPSNCIEEYDNEHGLDVSIGASTLASSILSSSKVESGLGISSMTKILPCLGQNSSEVDLAERCPYSRLPLSTVGLHSRRDASGSSGVSSVCSESPKLGSQPPELLLPLLRQTSLSSDGDDWKSEKRNTLTFPTEGDSSSFLLVLQAQSEYAVNIPSTKVDSPLSQGYDIVPDINFATNLHRIRNCHIKH